MSGPVLFIGYPNIVKKIDRLKWKETKKVEGNMRRLLKEGDKRRLLNEGVNLNYGKEDISSLVSIFPGATDFRL